MKSTRKLPERQSPAQLSATRRRVFLVVTLVTPVVFFLLLEVALRIVGYGPDLSLFTTEVLAGKTYTVMNADVKNRYFSSVTFNPSTSPDYFLTPKPTGTFRIFCLGGSTTVGYPYWYNGSFSSFLRDRLRQLFPDRTIEVINVGMTATNSFTVNDMAEELVDNEPDLFIVYDGHNEFYGALGVSSNESPAKARWITRLYLKAIHLKTFILVRAIYNGIRSAISPDVEEKPGATMMEKLAAGKFIPYNSQLYRDGLDTYRANLDELRTLCEEHAIPLLLGSQVSNLRSLHPFVSNPAPDLSEMQQKEFQALYDLGVTHWNSGEITGAGEAFRKALMIDSLRADAQFLLAHCLDSLGRKSEALKAYIRARDFDELRFRMSSDFNSVMRETCIPTGPVFVDIEKAFKAHSPDSLIGFQLIYEHLHPNSWGFYLMAREFAYAMRENGVLASPEDWMNRDTIPDQVFWDNRCVTDLDELLAIRRTEILTSGWPFRTQPTAVDAITEDDTLGQIVEKVTRARWNWGQAHNAAADHYLRRGDVRNAERELLTIINQLPLLEETPYLKLARLHIDQSRFADATKQLRASLEIKPTILAYRALADLSMNAGNPADAVTFYEKTFSFEQTPPERMDNGYLLALALFRTGNLQRSSSELLKVLNIKPDYQPATELLARVNAAMQQR
ncbi:MAG: tetratricopeptide repeat protein [Bacteroidota bacterium]